MIVITRLFFSGLLIAILLFAAYMGGLFYPRVDQDITLRGNNAATIDTYVWKNANIVYYNYHYEVPADKIQATKTADSLAALQSLHHLPK